MIPIQQTIYEFYRNIGGLEKQPTNKQYDVISVSALEDRGYDFSKLKPLTDLLPHGAFIAGGCLKNVFLNKPLLDTQDIDIFFTSEQAFKETYNLFDRDDLIKDSVISGYLTNRKESVFCKNSDKIMVVNFLKKNNPTIQLVKTMWYETPVKIIDSFDLTIVQFCTDGEVVYFNPESFNDLKNKQLKFHRTQSPLSAVRRLNKYMQQGFEVDSSKIADLVDAVCKLALEAKAIECLERGMFFYINDGETYGSFNQKWIVENWGLLKHSQYAGELFALLFGSK